MEFQARLAANLFILRIMIVGFVWIIFSWVVALLTIVVWLVCEKLLVESIYAVWMNEIKDHVQQHHDGNCKDCSDD